MTPPKNTVFCPICKYEYTYLGKHLSGRHSIINKVEKRLLINHATGRVNYRHLPCPVPDCGFNKTRVDRHLEQGHPELNTAEVQDFIKGIKNKVTIDGLRALRASNPSPPMISCLDIGEDQVLQQESVEDMPPSDTCASCTQLTAQVKELMRQLRNKDRRLKRYRATIKSLEQVCKIL